MSDQIEKVFLNQRAIQRIRLLIHKRLGIHIKEGKESLLRQRLWKLIQSNEFKDLNEICDHIENEKDSGLLLRLATLISTNHTYFFREKSHFDYLQKHILPNVKMDSNKLRVWSAASSSGEEVYTLCMVLAESLGKDRFLEKVAILGTDISQRVLQKAEYGHYLKENMSQIPPNYRLNYVESVSKDTFCIKEELKKVCLFRRLNLNMPRYPFKQKFHIIFCRNVFIYFDMPTQESICNEFARHAAPDAWLFISQTETLRNLNVPWKYVTPGVYRKK
ncbi:SAM-dependent methyltransferase [Candidatus Magnetomorum sp. HK-1]|nr:SAM-dependent methyltransferase [Candidatus Magnetomorum sp. HK-1]